MNLIKEINDMLRMPEVATYLGFEVNSRGFIRSPFHDEKTASCKLYKEPGRGYYDFSAGEGGDCIRFVARTQGLNNWESCRLLVEAFNLPIDMKSTHLTRQNVQKLKQQREADQKRKAVGKKKWVAEMDNLKAIIATCEELLKSPHIQPMSDLWCSVVEQRNRAIVRADELAGIETTARDLRLPERPEQRKAG